MLLQYRTDSNFSFNPLGCCKQAGYIILMLFLVSLFLTVFFRQTSSTSTGTVFANFSDLVELYLFLYICFLSPMGRCRDNQFVLSFCAELSFGDICQMAK